MWERNEWISSWLSWLAVLVVGAYDGGGVAQHGGHTPAIRLTETCNLGLWRPSLILDIHAMVN